jgi:hypothetical protein
MMQTRRSFCLLLPASASCCFVLADDAGDEFKNPPAALRPMPFWHINGALTTEEIKAQLRDSRDKSGFGGVAVLPVAETQPKYLSEDYFASYADILDTARELGMEVVLYDDTGFPSGTAGGRLSELFPDDTLKRLDMTEEVVQGPADYVKVLPAGALMSVVAMNTQTLQRLDITASASGGNLAWKAPEGNWNVMVFTCVRSTTASGKRLVDFLSAEAVDKYIPLTYGEYFKRFSKDFGATIRRDYFDDVGFYAQDRPWTPAFNEKYQKKYGVSPVLLYPVLWRDIGPETAAARVALFGFRAELLAEGYPARIGAWCRAHGIQSQGHPPGNYDPCPVDMHGDTFKFYRHVDIPLMDAIFFHGHGRSGFKLISSAATMYDRPLVAAEEYGAFPEKTFDSAMLYRTGMELFARGVNRVIPHGMWLDPQHVRIAPLISHFSAKLLPALPDYNQWAARCSLLLQGGRPVVDIAMLYPIAALEAYYNFSLPDRMRWGKYVPPEADYQRLSDMLTCDIRRDFTFLHPDALAAQCTRQGATLRLNNATSWQAYRVLIIPGGKVIPWASLKKIKDFYDHGGRVVATTCLPEKSAESGYDADVQKTVSEMFGARTETNRNGGKVYFAPSPTASTLQAILDDALPVPDVAFDPNLRVGSGNGVLSYLHKQKDGREVYYFANSSDDAVDTEVRLRGDRVMQLWNPHTGEKAPAEVTHLLEHGEAATRLRLKIAPVTSLFAITQATSIPNHPTGSRSGRFSR